MTAVRTIGVFGGTFDPPHLGHLAAAEDVRAKLGLDRVLFIPNNVPPHKLDQRVSSPDDRVRMVEAAIAGNAHFQLCTIELERPGPSFILDTLRLLRARIDADTRLLFLTGRDALLGLHTWHEPDTLLEEFGLVLMTRLVDDEIDWARLETRFPRIRRQTLTVDIPLLEISGNDLRRRVREGRPIRYYVPSVVEDIIRERGLYLEGP